MTGASCRPDWQKPGAIRHALHADALTFLLRFTYLIVTNIFAGGVPPAAKAQMRFVFADHTLDIDRRELLFGTKPVALEPRVFDLLAYLVANRDRVVSRGDVFAQVWSGRIVSDSR